MDFSETCKFELIKAFPNASVTFVPLSAYHVRQNVWTLTNEETVIQIFV